MTDQCVQTGTSASVERGAQPAPEGGRQWFALSVVVRHEKMVSQMLNNKGFETFLPLYARQHQYARRVRRYELPLFSGYLFCRTDPAARLPILTTPGVLQMIGAGRVPIPVEDTEVLALQKAAGAGFAMAPYPFWRHGQIGRITAGPLAGVEGIVVNAKHMTANRSARLVLSVSLLQRSVLLEIGCDSVALA
jgi:transcription antitermination factor NusG